MKTFFEEIKSTVKNWWVSLVVGILFIGLGIWLIMAPVTSYVVLATLFSIFMFISGLSEIIFSISNKDIISSWGWYLAGGIIDLLLGVILIATPGLSEAVLPFILAFWLMFRGISGIGSAIDLRRLGSKSWGWDLAVAILALLCAFGVIWMPLVGAMTLVMITSFTFVVFGIFRIMIAIELKQVYNRIKR